MRLVIFVIYQTPTPPPLLFFSTHPRVTVPAANLERVVARGPGLLSDTSPLDIFKSHEYVFMTLMEYLSLAAAVGGDGGSGDAGISPISGARSVLFSLLSKTLRAHVGSTDTLDLHDHAEDMLWTTLSGERVGLLACLCVRRVLCCVLCAVCFVGACVLYAMLCAVLWMVLPFLLFIIVTPPPRHTRAQLHTLACNAFSRVHWRVLRLAADANCGAAWGGRGGCVGVVGGDSRPGGGLRSRVLVFALRSRRRHEARLL